MESVMDKERNKQECKFKALQRSKDRINVNGYVRGIYRTRNITAIAEEIIDNIMAF